MRTSILALIVVGICTAAAAQDRDQQAADLFRQAIAEQRALARQSQVSASDVGDADSFGRNVHFIGVAQTGTVAVQEDCTPDPGAPPGPDDRCVVALAPPAITTVVARDVGRMRLPANAANSILCQAVTLQPFWHFNNPTATPGDALFQYRFGFTIDNNVLDDPNLIDPTTGNPFGGSLEIPFGNIVDLQTLQPGNQATKRTVNARFCIGGISKGSLTGVFGLTAEQADDFFKKPIREHLRRPDREGDALSFGLHPDEMSLECLELGLEGDVLPIEAHRLRHHHVAR